MTVQTASKQLLFQLFELYEEREARNIADLVMENITEWKRIDRIINKEVTLSVEKERLLSRYTNELLANKPVQYVLLEAWFYGMKFYVDENVLIPRPETEELVEWVLTEGAKNTPVKPRILDLGTGSGCIAVALKKKWIDAKVFACDVSKKALEVAANNATLNNTPIDFILCDFLDEQQRNSLPAVDIITSNPPYVPFQDKKAMRLNVLNYEPPLALFVEDDDPLLFYRLMVKFCQTRHKEKIMLFVEIHEGSGKEVTELFELSGFADIELKKDLQGRDRMVRASWS
ncbi:MAG: peptide chain release factor N(5)-glutamine methyltransferase [Chitinophagaceae bacterium]